MTTIPDQATADSVRARLQWGGQAVVMLHREHQVAEHQLRLAEDQRRDGLISNLDLLGLRTIYEETRTSWKAGEQLLGNAFAAVSEWWPTALGEEQDAPLEWLVAMGPPYVQLGADYWLGQLRSLLA